MARSSQFVMRIAVLALACASVTTGLIAAPAARADCESISGTMVCSDGQDGQSTGIFAPDPCDLDWYCDDDDVILGSDGPGGPSEPGDGPPDLGQPGRPDIGRPGRPGNRP